MKKQSTELTEVKTTNKFKTVMEKIGKRNIIIACAVFLIGAAVVLNFVLFSGNETPDGYGGYDQPSGNLTGDTGNGDKNDADKNEDSKDTYFSGVLVSRQRARDEALEVLQSVVDNKDATDAMKSEAMAGIAAIADEIQKEANIESLITAKGFDQCIAVLNGDSASIIVSADSLQAAQVAQISAIVYEQAGIKPADLTIINK